MKGVKRPRESASPGDFALWKVGEARRACLGKPMGQRAARLAYRMLGDEPRHARRTFDIHGGGLDLMFPHHENEIAQSECCHGKPMVKYWLHNGLMQSGCGRQSRRTGRTRTRSGWRWPAKISRSAGAGGLAQLIARQGGERIRFFLLRTHYRSTIVFSEEGIAEAGTGLETFYDSSNATNGSPATIVLPFGANESPCGWRIRSG